MRAFVSIFSCLGWGGGNFHIFFFLSNEPYSSVLAAVPVCRRGPNVSIVDETANGMGIDLCCGVFEHESQVPPCVVLDREWLCVGGGACMSPCSFVPTRSFLVCFTGWQRKLDTVPSRCAGLSPPILVQGVLL